MQAFKPTQVKIGLGFLAIVLITVGLFIFSPSKKKAKLNSSENLSQIRSCLKSQVWPELKELRDFKDATPMLENAHGQLLNKIYYFERSKTNYQLNITPITDEDRSFVQIELSSVSASGSHLVRSEQKLQLTEEEIQMWLEDGAKIDQVTESWLYSSKEFDVEVSKSNKDLVKMVFRSASNRAEVECLPYEKGIDQVFDSGFGSGLNCQCLSR